MWFRNVFPEPTSGQAASMWYIKEGMSEWMVGWVGGGGRMVKRKQVRLTEVIKNHPPACLSPLVLQGACAGFSLFCQSSQ